MSDQADIAEIDAILSDWTEVIGDAYGGYRNHVVRMVSFCLALRPCTPEERRKIHIAACFHDIGLWTAKTLDYLPPSVPPAIAYLKAHDLESWAGEIEAMILEHHKLNPVKTIQSPLVEVFRQGDLVDFSLGSVRFGLPGELIREIKALYPNAGFHANLLKLALKWFVRHPLNPAPMMKW